MIDFDHGHAVGFRDGFLYGLIIGFIIGGVAMGIAGYGWAHREIEFEHLLKLGDKIMDVEREIFNERK